MSSRRFALTAISAKSRSAPTCPIIASACFAGARGDGRGRPEKLDQPALRHRGLDKRREQGMRFERARFQLGMELDPNEPGMVLVFDDLRQHAIGRQAEEAKAVLFEPVLVGGVDLVAVAMAF